MTICYSSDKLERVFVGPIQRVSVCGSACVNSGLRSGRSSKELHCIYCGQRDMWAGYGAQGPTCMVA